MLHFPFTIFFEYLDDCWNDWSGAIFVKYFNSKLKLDVGKNISFCILENDSYQFWGMLYALFITFPVFFSELWDHVG